MRGLVEGATRSRVVLGTLASGRQKTRFEKRGVGAVLPRGEVGLSVFVTQKVLFEVVAEYDQLIEPLKDVPYPSLFGN